MTRIDVLDKGYVRIVDHMGSDLSIVNAARVSYDKESEEFNERDTKLLSYLIKHDHNSVLRHAAISYEIYAPLMVARQWWKYAVASTHIDDQNGWNESSRRYVTEKEEFYYPEYWRHAPKNSKQGSGDNLSETSNNFMNSLLEKHYEESEKLYAMALLNKVAPEQARLFLPSYGLYVRWRWTTSLSTVLHFLSQRLDDSAQQEIQRYAEAIKQLTEPLYPKTFAAAL
jgi:thymidylate synthase (FAD)